jgi:hypothetical protein
LTQPAVKQNLEANPSSPEELLVRTINLVRWLLVLPAAAAAGWIVYYVASEITGLLGLEAPHWMWILIKLYAYLLIGFMFTGVGTKVAPDHKDRVTYALLFLCVATGAWIMFTCPDGTPIGITLGVSIVAGAAGYAFRIRGFGPTREYV